MQSSHPQLKVRQSIDIRHQVPGRTRVRIAALKTTPRLETRLEAALRALDGVQAVRINATCASVTLYHRLDWSPRREALQAALQPILSPSAVQAQPAKDRPGASGRAKALTRSSTPRAALPALGSANAHRARPASCPLCQLKLKAARWILADVWRCWREYWTRRLQERFVASLALFRS